LLRSTPAEKRERNEELSPGTAKARPSQVSCFPVPLWGGACATVGCARTADPCLVQRSGGTQRYRGKVREIPIGKILACELIETGMAEHLKNKKPSSLAEYIYHLFERNKFLCWNPWTESTDGHATMRNDDKGCATRTLTSIGELDAAHSHLFRQPPPPWLITNPDPHRAFFHAPRAHEVGHQPPLDQVTDPFSSSAAHSLGSMT
jgi:hypothetical protein